MSDGQIDLSQVSEEFSEEDIVYILAAFGANQCSANSYDQKMRAMYENFCRLDLGVISNMWDRLDDRVKIRILNINSAKFKDWIRSYSNNSCPNSYSLKA